MPALLPQRKKHSALSLARCRPSAVLIVLSFLWLGFAGCATPLTAYREPAPLAPRARTALNGQVFDTAWQLVNEKYFDPHFRGVNWVAMRAHYRPAALAAKDDSALYLVLGQMCGELRESHLTPLAPRRTHEIKTDRRIAVGMVWRLLDGRHVVTEVIPGGPAADAGVEAGWFIVSRNGQPLDDTMPFVNYANETVTYGFVDLDNHARAIEFKPEPLKIQQLASRELPGGHRYLRFDRFDRESLRWLSEQLKAHHDAPGVVLDLRENPGGLVVVFQLALSEFFDRRISTGEFVRRSGRVTRSKGLSFFSAHYPGRVVVLTSAATGSAAEIFAHVLQHEGRATIVGRRTAGAVIVARDYALPGGGRLQIPIQDYRGLDGRRLEGRGVIPDIGVPMPALADLRTGRDPDLEMAVAALDGSATVDHAPFTARSAPQTDEIPFATLR